MEIILLIAIVILYFLVGIIAGKNKIRKNNLRTSQVYVIQTTKNAKLPCKGSEEAAGYDLYASLDKEDTKIIPPHATVKINTGLKMAIPKGYFGAIFARSGLATKQGLRPANCVGVIDSDYRGEVIVALHNDTATNKVINNGDRIAQLSIIPYEKCEFIKTDKLDKTIRGEGGFGSSGK